MLGPWLNTLSPRRLSTEGKILGSSLLPLTQHLGYEWGQMPWGEEGQDISQKPRVHIGIHMSTPFPQKALQGPGPAQGNWGANLGTCPQ